MNPQTMPFKKFLTIYYLSVHLALIVLGGILRGGSMHPGVIDMFMIVVIIFYEYFLGWNIVLFALKIAGPKRFLALAALVLPVAMGINLLVRLWRGT